MKLFEDLPSTKVPIIAENLNQIKDNLVVVSPTEPTGDNREKVWIQNTDTEQKMYLLNDNNVYEEVINTKLEQKVDKVSGKGLSTNDFTSAYKTKLDGIATGATKNTVENSLTSTSTTNALSANQGKVLNNSITNLKPVSLYNNSSGTTGTVTLSESAANFSYLEIFYNIGGNYASIKVYAPNNKYASLQVSYSISQYNVSRLQYKTVQISGTSITPSKYGYLSASTTGVIDANVSENAILINKVVGYR